MPDKALRMTRAVDAHDVRSRPVMLAIAGDSATGKTTLTKGLVEALGEDNCVQVCTDDYHRYDREERKGLPFTALHPDCNYMEIMQRDLQSLAMGHPILKPVYDHHTGKLTRPELIEPRKYVIIEGLLPLHTKLSRACFDVMVYLNPPEEVRRDWKVSRDTRDRGYSVEQVLAELDRREPESAEFIRPQMAYSDIIVRFAPIAERHDPPGTPLSAELTLRPTIRYPDLSEVVNNQLPVDSGRPIHLKLARDTHGRPVDVLHVHGYVSREVTSVVEKSIWNAVGHDGGVPECLGQLGGGKRSEPLAITQLLLLYHMLKGIH